MIENNIFLAKGLGVRSVFTICVFVALIFLPLINGDISALIAHLQMAAFFLFLMAILARTSRVWFAFPLILTLVLGFRISKLFSQPIPPFLWLLSGAALFLTWADIVVSHNKKRFSHFCKKIHTKKLVSKKEIVRFHLLSWVMLLVFASLYAIALPLTSNQSIKTLLALILFGSIVGSLLSFMCGKYRWFIVLFIAPAFISLTIRNPSAITVILFCWLSGYIVSCLIEGVPGLPIRKAS